MEHREKNIEVKKQIMFNLENDYYFITYNLIYILYVMECNNERKRFKDYTKLAYMIPFISDDSLLYIVQKENEMPSRNERRKLKEIYIKSRMQQKLLLLIIYALEKKDMVSIYKREKADTLDLWINTSSIPSDFFNKSLYHYEISNTKTFLGAFPRFNQLKAETFLKRLFTDKGVSIWDF